MDVIKERIPLLLSQARTRATDRKAAEASLYSAEQILLSTRHSRMAGRYWWNTAAEHIAETWYSITADPDKAECCLLVLVGHESNTSAWIKMASGLRIALGAKYFERTWDCRTRKYLIMAEENADTCQHWCDCSNAWKSESDDWERSLNCLFRAESMATSFFDFMACANAWRRHYGRLKVMEWAGKASERAITSRDWLRCAEVGVEVDEFEIRRCLAKAEEKAGSCEDYLLCAFAIDRHMGTREFASVLRCLDCAERSRPDREDWCRLVSAGYAMRHNAEHVHEPVIGVANREAFETHYNNCLQRFLDIHPQTQDWLRLVKGIRWGFTRVTDVNFMLSAETAARSAQDWMDCAAVWGSSELPDAKKHASICRLRALRSK